MVTPTWLGEFIGTIKTKDVLMKKKVGKHRMYLLNFDNYEEWCYIKPYKNDYPCFYDILQRVLGLNNQGVNVINIVNRKYIIGRYINGEIINEFSNHIDDIKKIVILRKLVNNNYLFKDIYLLDDNSLLDMSYNKEIHEESKIPMTILNIYFPKFLDLEKFLFSNMLEESDDPQDWYMIIDDINNKYFINNKYSFEGLDILTKKLIKYNKKLK